MTKWHRFGAPPQPTGGQVGAVKYRGSVHHILITHVDPKTTCAELFKSNEFVTSQAVVCTSYSVHEYTLKFPVYQYTWLITTLISHLSFHTCMFMWVSSGFSSFLRLSKKHAGRSISFAKLPPSVNKCVCCPVKH